MIYRSFLKELDKQFSHLNVESTECYLSVLRDPTHLREREADLFPVNASLEEFNRKDYISIASNSLFFRKNVKYMTALRTILTMIRNDDEDLGWFDIFALFEIILRVESTLLGQAGFVNRFGSTLKVVTELLASLDWAPSRPERTLKIFRLGLKALPAQFFFNDRNIRQMKLEMRESILLRRRTPQGVELKYLPPKSFIGKGYGDKGTARRPEIDGSPSWQEVAMSHLTSEEKRDVETFY